MHFGTGTGEAASKTEDVVPLNLCQRTERSFSKDENKRGGSRSLIKSSQELNPKYIEQSAAGNTGISEERNGGGCDRYSRSCKQSCEG
jgi:hypothetical protein